MRIERLLLHGVTQAEAGQIAQALAAELSRARRGTRAGVRVCECAACAARAFPGSARGRSASAAPLPPRSGRACRRPKERAHDRTGFSTGDEGRHRDAGSRHRDPARHHHAPIQPGHADPPSAAAECGRAGRSFGDPAPERPADRDDQRRRGDRRDRSACRSGGQSARDHASASSRSSPRSRCWSIRRAWT